jgi:hypothetical protein
MAPRICEEGVVFFQLWRGWQHLVVFKICTSATKYMYLPLPAGQRRSEDSRHFVVGMDKLTGVTVEKCAVH